MVLFFLKGYSCWAFGVATLLSYELKIIDRHRVEEDFAASVQRLIDHCQPEDARILPKDRVKTLQVLQYVRDNCVGFRIAYDHDEPPKKDRTKQIPKASINERVNKCINITVNLSF